MRLYDLNGTLRSTPPKNTLQIARQLAKKIGITRVAELTQLDDIGLPVFACIRPSAKSLTISQGKGITKELALCSAYMEAVEHYFAESIPFEEILFEDLKQRNCLYIHPENLPKNNLYRQVQSFDRWVRGENLFNGKIYFIPYSYVSLDFTQFEGNIFAKTSTGLASGNTKKEALIHSLCEIIERNAVHEFFLSENKQERNIKLNTINLPLAKKLISKIMQTENSIEIYDITNKFNISSYYCVLSCLNPARLMGKFYGSGTHISQDIAICRAITEAAQSRLSYISGARDDIFPEQYQLLWTDEPANALLNFLRRDIPFSLEAENILKILLSAFNDNNCKEVIVIDHTQGNKELNFSVVQAIVQGLPI